MFKIILKNKDNHQIDVDYELYDSLLAEKWAKKIKHLKRVPIDPIESGICNVSDIQDIYKKFCEFANLEPMDIEPLDQSMLNKLHKIYEKQHETLSRIKNNELLYKFHHSIHYNEIAAASQRKTAEWKGTENEGRIVVGWGIKEGPLTEQFDCHSYYADKIEKNNIYLYWAELGKKPWQYHRDKEPNNQKRVNELCKPHITFRAKFLISFKDITPSEFTPDFSKWFDQYKQAWFKAYKIQEYTPIHVYSAPLLAHTSNKQDLTGYKFVRIES